MWASSTGSLVSMAGESRGALGAFSRAQKALSSELVAPSGAAPDMCARANAADMPASLSAAFVLPSAASFASAACRPLADARASWEPRSPCGALSITRTMCA